MTVEWVWLCIVPSTKHIWTYSAGLGSTFTFFFSEKERCYWYELVLDHQNWKIKEMLNPFLFFHYYSLNSFLKSLSWFFFENQIELSFKNVSHPCWDGITSTPLWILVKVQDWLFYHLNIYNIALHLKETLANSQLQPYIGIIQVKYL